LVVSATKVNSSTSSGTDTPSSRSTKGSPLGTNLLDGAARLAQEQLARGMGELKEGATAKLGNTAETAVLTALRNYGGLIITPIQLALALPRASSSVASFLGPVFRTLLGGEDKISYHRFLDAASSVANRDLQELERIKSSKPNDKEVEKLENLILVEGFAANPDLYFSAIARNLFKIVKSGNLGKFKEKIFGMIPSTNNPLLASLTQPLKSLLNNVLNLEELNPNAPPKGAKKTEGIFKMVDSLIEGLVSKVTPEGNIRKYSKWGILGLGTYLLVTKIVLPLIKWVFYGATAFFGVKAAGKMLGGVRKAKDPRREKGILEGAQEGLKNAAQTGKGLINKGHGLLDTVDKMSLGFARPFTEPLKKALHTANQVVSPAAA
jgi:hypothetical protein